MLKIIATELAKWFKRLPILGRQRFWILYLAYKITGWHIRHSEWDFILKYLPKLGSWQKVDLFDVGCSRNLFCHEVNYRDYNLYGVDVEDPGFKYPGTFGLWDITKGRVYSSCNDDFDFVTCISVLEHIGNNGKGDYADQKKAIFNMCASLKVGGRLLLTCPTKEYAQGHPWHGFTWQEIEDMIPSNLEFIEKTERAGQLCMALEKTE